MLFFMGLYWVGYSIPSCQSAGGNPSFRSEEGDSFVFLVTADGLRPQELFGGIDPTLVDERNLKSSGIENLPALRETYWADGPTERRERLMPFFWKTLAHEGIILGNPAKGSRTAVKNRHRFSYPCYAEILNGEPQAAIDSNERVFSPRQTLLEHIRRQFGLETHQVAAFASWDVFNWITMHTEGDIYCNAGYEAVPPAMLTPEMDIFNKIQFEMLTPWDAVRHDTVTLGLALGYIERYKPKLFYLALGETDDWAHERRYDRMVQAIRVFDDALRKLWETLQSTEPYRGRTTLVVTTDHGRGSGLDEWTSHGSQISGSNEIWIGVFGPETPNLGELLDTSRYTSSHIAATILRFYGLDYRRFNPKAEPPISEAFLR
jgi:hypothetical protein